MPTAVALLRPRLRRPGTCTGTGDWLGLVSYTILYVDLVPSAGLELQDQLVPADR